MIDKRRQMEDVNRPLNHPIELWKDTPSGTNRHGEKTFEPVLVERTHALVIPDRGREYGDNWQVYQAQAYKVTMRYRPDIDPTWWIVFNGKHLNIEAVPDLQSRTMYIELLCTEKVVTGDGSGDVDSGDWGIY